MDRVALAAASASGQPGRRHRRAIVPSRGVHLIVTGMLLETSKRFGQGEMTLACGRGGMEERAALAALSAMANETRLAVFRLLVEVGPNGRSAGAIGQQLGVPASTLSFHLKEMERGGLVRSWRRQRQIFYAAHYEGIRGLLTFLTEDCCGGHPEICGDLARFAGTSPEARADEPQEA